MAYYFEAACSSSIGLKRSNNEDNFLFNGIVLDEENSGSDGILTASGDSATPFVCAVFDGMGGYACGETASYLAALTFKEDHNPDLAAVCLDANSEICAYAKEFNVSSLGSTAAVARLEADTLSILNIGDSRMFLYENDKLRQISVDHTDSERVEKFSLKRKPFLTQHLGIPEDEFLIEPYTNSFPLQSGARLLICSDGLTDMVDPGGIEKILRMGESAESCVKYLESEALKNGGKDNITIIVCNIKQNFLQDKEEQ